MKELSFHEQFERSELIKDGFTYGSRGSSGLKKVLNVAMGLVEEHANDGPAISRQVRTSVEKQLAQLNTSILGDFFSKTMSPGRYSLSPRSSSNWPWQGSFPLMAQQASSFAVRFSACSTTGGSTG